MIWFIDAALIIVIIVLMAITLQLRAKNKARNTEELELQDLEFRAKFLQAFKFNAPRNDAQLAELQPRVIETLIELGSTQPYLIEVANSHMVHGDPAGGVVAILASAFDSQSPNGSRARYKAMRELALAAGFDRDQLDELDLKISESAKSKALPT